MLRFYCYECANWVRESPDRGYCQQQKRRTDARHEAERDERDGRKRCEWESGPGWSTGGQS